MSELQYIARVFVPPKAGRGRSATAYPIAPDCVITAAHFLKDGDYWHERAEILWSQHEATIELDWQSAEVVWNGHDEGYDIAVLRTKFPDAIKGFAEPSWVPPPIGREFDLRGFAAVGARDDGRRAVSFLGKILAHLPIDAEIPIGVTFGPELEEGWHGASGSPIIINSRLYGVLVFSPLGLGARQVQAVSIHKLIRNHAFLEKAGLSVEKIDEVRRKDAIREIVSILQGLRLFADGVIEKLIQEGILDGNVNLLSELAKLEAVANRLFSSDVKVSILLRCFFQVVREVRSSLTARNAAELIRFVGLLLPFVGDGILPLKLMADPQQPILTLNAVSHAMAELALARLENRIADFSLSDESGNLPRGKRGLSRKELYLPEGGAASTPEGMAREAIMFLCKKFFVIDENTKRRIPILQEEVQSLSWSVRINLLKKRLRKYREQGGSVYYAYSDHENKQHNGKLDVIATEFYRQVPEIKFMKLTGADEVYETEYEHLELLSELLDILENGGSKS